MNTRVFFLFSFFSQTQTAAVRDDAGKKQTNRIKRKNKQTEAWEAAFEVDEKETWCVR